MPARAPYNFIPLPERAIDVREQFDVDSPHEEALKQSLVCALPPHHRYDPDRLHGWFEVELTTETPLFIGGMQQEGANDADNEARQSNFFNLTRPEEPVIPGSSLRGMVRSLFEIATFSSMKRVTDQSKIFYRAVAAASEQSIGDAYDNIIGKLSKNVQAGYLRQVGERWYIQPAQKIGTAAFEKVNTQNVASGDVTGLIPFTDANYHIQVHPVIYQKHSGTKPNGKPLTWYTVRSPQGDEKATGTLIASGNMAENQANASGDVKTPRRAYTLIGVADETAQRIEIDSQAVEDYCDALTPFQKGDVRKTGSGSKREPLFDEQWGWLADGHPVFYVKESEHNKVNYFGHSPNFRIPALIEASVDGKPVRRAKTPRDFVPPELQSDKVYDFGEAAFGFIDHYQPAEGVDVQGKVDYAYASRVTMTDAKLCTGQKSVLETQEKTVVLSSPKPTSFQHYLEQDDDGSTTPKKLNHFESQAARVSGHKLYWRQHLSSTTSIPDAGTDQQNVSTTLRAVRPNVRFRFRVHFNNLTTIELGALAWTLTLPFSHKAYHMLGMGKPFGMGVVKLKPKLYLDNRLHRYQRLFAEDGNWELGRPSNIEMTAYINDFKHFIALRVRAESFESIPRIQHLQAMLIGRDIDASKFSYMQIERSNPAIGETENEYKACFALARPLHVVNEVAKNISLEESEALTTDMLAPTSMEQAHLNAPARPMLQRGTRLSGTAEKQGKGREAHVGFYIDKLNYANTDKGRYFAYFEDDVPLKQRIDVEVIDIDVSSDPKIVYVLCKQVE